MSRPRMKDFWDERADEDAFYFVDNSLDYRHPDIERFWASGEEVVERMLDLLGSEIEPDDDIVEIGCGLGRITRALEARGASVRAIDVSERMLEKARELNPHLETVTWLLGDGDSLNEIESDSADVCHSYVVFQHVPDPEITLRYVAEMGRVLRTGGFAFFQMSNSPGEHASPPVRERLRLRLGALVGRIPHGQMHPAWRGSWVDLGRLEAVAAENGMEVEKVVGPGSFFCFVQLRKK